MIIFQRMRKLKARTLNLRSSHPSGKSGCCPVSGRRNLDIGIQDAEAALDIGKALVAADGLGGVDVLGANHRQKGAVEKPGLSLGGFIGRLGEAIGDTADTKKFSLNKAFTLALRSDSVVAGGFPRSIERR